MRSRALVVACLAWSPVVLAGCFELVLRESDPRSARDEPELRSDASTTRRGGQPTGRRDGERDGALRRASDADVPDDGEARAPGRAGGEPSRPGDGPRRAEPLPDMAPCLESDECRPGSWCLYQHFDCSPETRGRCIYADFCDSWLIPFCGCDGTSFAAPGNCVTRAHAHAGVCR